MISECKPKKFMVLQELFFKLEKHKQCSDKTNTENQIFVLSMLVTTRCIKTKKISQN